MTVVFSERVGIVVVGPGSRGRGAVPLGQRHQLAVGVVLNLHVPVGIGDSGPSARGGEIVSRVGVLSLQSGGVSLGEDLPGRVIGVHHVVAGVGPTALAVRQGHGEHQVGRVVGERCDVPLGVGHAGEIARTVITVGGVLAIGVGDLGHKSVGAVREGDRPAGGWVTVDSFPDQ